MRCEATEFAVAATNRSEVGHAVLSVLLILSHLNWPHFTWNQWHWAPLPSSPCHGELGSGAQCHWFHVKWGQL